jgi:hypothetical protein
VLCDGHAKASAAQIRAIGKSVMRAALFRCEANFFSRFQAEAGIVWYCWGRRLELQPSSGEAFVGYISSFVAQLQGPNRPKFVMCTVHPDWVTLAGGIFRQGVNPPPYFGIESVLPVPLYFFTTPAVSEWVLTDDGQHGLLPIDHTEDVYLSLWEETSIWGSLKIVEYSPEDATDHISDISIRSLTVKDHQSKGIVLYGLAENGAAVSILIQP